MSAALKLDDASVDSVLAASLQRMEADEREIASLKRQREAMGERIALIQAEKNEIELRLSLQILKIHDGYLNRITALELRAKDAEDHLNRIANFVQGMPQREEFERLKESVNGLLARETV